MKKILSWRTSFGILATTRTRRLFSPFGTNAASIAISMSQRLEMAVFRLTPAAGIVIVCSCVVATYTVASAVADNPVMDAVALISVSIITDNEDDRPDMDSSALMAVSPSSTEKNSARFASVGRMARSASTSVPFRRCRSARDVGGATNALAVMAVLVGVLIARSANAADNPDRVAAVVMSVPEAALATMTAEPEGLGRVVASASMIVGPALVVARTALETGADNAVVADTLSVPTGTL